MTFLSLESPFLLLCEAEIMGPCFPAPQQGQMLGNLTFLLGLGVFISKLGIMNNLSGKEA